MGHGEHGTEIMLRCNNVTLPWLLMTFYPRHP